MLRALAERLRGAEAATLVDRDAAVFVHQEASTPCLSGLRSAKGIWLEDLDGRRWMDFHGNSVHTVGHAHPRLLAALKAQLDGLAFSPRRYTNEPAVRLAEKLVELWPGGPAKVLFATGGSDAIEIALKLARAATRRHETMSFEGSYHGDGLGALGLSGKPSLARLGPLLPGRHHVPPYWLSPEASAGAIRRLLRERPIGAVIAEPIRASAHVPPPGFWPEVKRLCRAAGALLVFDEIPTGLGRTGRFFAAERVEAVPDITVMGKALGGGLLPIAAAIVRADLDVAPELDLGHYTHEKNPLTTTVALETINIVLEERLAERAERLGALAFERTADWAGRLPLFERLRGVGLLLAVQLRDHPATGRPRGEIAAAVAARCFEQGLSLVYRAEGAIGLLPPLTIAEEDLLAALSILEAAIMAEG